MAFPMNANSTTPVQNEKVQGQPNPGAARLAARFTKKKKKAPPMPPPQQQGPPPGAMGGY